MKAPTLPGLIQTGGKFALIWIFLKLCLKCLAERWQNPLASFLVPLLLPFLPPLLTRRVAGFAAVKLLRNTVGEGSFQIVRLPGFLKAHSSRRLSSMSQHAICIT